MASTSSEPEVLDKEDAPQHPRSGKRKWLIGLLVAVVILGLALGLGLGLGLNHGSGSNSGSDSDGGGDDNNGGGNSTSPNPSGNSTGIFAVNSPWQIVLSETLDIDDTVSPNPSSNPKVSVYDIDMFMHQNMTVIKTLQDMNITVICYFSAGSYEPNRPDSWKFQSGDKGKELDGWPGEYWLDLNSDNVRNIMTSRLDIASRMGCDAVDPDNVDGYDNDNGLDLTPTDSANFMKFLAQGAASRNMSIGLKNAAEIIDDVIDLVAFSVNEQCVQYGDCDQFSAFAENNKPVFHIEYPLGDDDTQATSFDKADVNKYCDTKGDGFNTVLKYMNLSGMVQYCDGDTYTTDGQ